MVYIYPIPFIINRVIPGKFSSTGAFALFQKIKTIIFRFHILGKGMPEIIFNDLPRHATLLYSNHQKSLMALAYGIIHIPLMAGCDIKDSVNLHHFHTTIIKGITHLSEIISGNTCNMRRFCFIPVPVIADHTDDFLCVVFSRIILALYQIIAVGAIIKATPEIQFQRNTFLAFDIKIIIVILNTDRFFLVKNSHIPIIQADQIRISLQINSTVVPRCGQKGVICFHISRREKQDAEQQDHKDKNIFFSLHNFPHCQKGMRHQAHPF